MAHPNRVAAFTERVRALGDRLGPVRIVVQQARDDAFLARLLDSLDSELDWALDFRHESWAGAETGRAAVVNAARRRCVVPLPAVPRSAVRRGVARGTGGADTAARRRRDRGLRVLQARGRADRARVRGAAARTARRLTRLTERGRVCVVLARRSSLLTSAAPRPMRTRLPARPGPDLTLRTADGTRGSSPTAGEPERRLRRTGPPVRRRPVTVGPLRTAARMGSATRAIALDLRGFGRSQHRVFPAGLRFSARHRRRGRSTREGCGAAGLRGRRLAGSERRWSPPPTSRPLIDGVVSLSGPSHLPARRGRRRRSTSSSPALRRRRGRPGRDVQDRREGDVRRRSGGGQAARHRPRRHARRRARRRPRQGADAPSSASSPATQRRAQKRAAAPRCRSWTPDARMSSICPIA